MLKKKTFRKVFILHTDIKIQRMNLNNGDKQINSEHHKTSY